MSGARVRGITENGFFNKVNRGLLGSKLIGCLYQFVKTITIIKRIQNKKVLQGNKNRILKRLHQSQQFSRFKYQDI